MTPATNVQLVASTMTALGLEWDWFPMPRFPAGVPVTYGGGSWYGLSTRSPLPQGLLAEVLAVLCAERGFQELLFRLAYQPPARLDLWRDWVEVLQRVAPALRHRRLEAFATAAPYALPNHYFRYQPYTAEALLQLWLLAIFDGRVEARQGLAAAAQAIDALEAAGAGTSPAAAVPAARPPRATPS